MKGTLYVVVNGRMVKASEVPKGEGMNIEYHDHRHGNLSATRYTRRALGSAEYLGNLPHRFARLVGRKRPTAA